MSIQPQFIILPIATLLLIAAGLTFVMLFYRLRTDTGRWKLIHEHDWTHQGFAFAGWLLAGFGGILLIITAILFMPYNGKYLVYNHVQGSVESVSNHFQTGSGDITTSDFVLRLNDHEGVYNVQDDRIAGVKAGTHVDLTCTVQWVYQGQDQNNCFVRSW